MVYLTIIPQARVGYEMIDSMGDIMVLTREMFSSGSAHAVRSSTPGSFSNDDGDGGDDSF